MSSSSSAAKPLRCPICGKNAVDAYRPFCSKRCADIDLARWFSGSYGIAGRDEDEGDPAAPADRQSGSGGDDEEA
ncbi:DNA gyrase inhibitor YacG [Hyphomicrobium sp.]|uniref:DNA gyrase inhibitor YacG n=1 Tax=Hyphomicrobium sp. TaxID=82 RepID=UPI000FB37FFD|nr:DNA gyrase inhibitor YacG [Hyphomicrobium sp.]RUO99717.1 MAG: DNA gyrase inhibitor YacG [Hyphomicrobium sp.]